MHDFLLSFTYITHAQDNIGMSAERRKAGEIQEKLLTELSGKLTEISGKYTQVITKIDGMTSAFLELDKQLRIKGKVIEDAFKIREHTRSITNRIHMLPWKQSLFLKK